METRLIPGALALAVFMLTPASSCSAQGSTPDDDAYPALVALFDEWRAFERPPTRDGAPDYRRLPQLRAIASPEEYDRRANEAVTKYLRFLEEKEVLRVRDYMDPALHAPES